jgi:hypothetical protein
LETSVNKYELGIECPPYCLAKKKREEEKKYCLNHAETWMELGSMSCGILLFLNFIYKKKKKIADYI